MELIKKYTAIQVFTRKVNSEITASFTYGNIDGPYYDEKYPEEEFETEQEAIDYAGKKDSYATWIIVPVIRFKN